jgi:hypothetical protein
MEEKQDVLAAPVQVGLHLVSEIEERHLPAAKDHVQGETYGTPLERCAVMLFGTVEKTRRELSSNVDVLNMTRPHTW